jgi:hypothetical protein
MLLSSFGSNREETVPAVQVPTRFVWRFGGKQVRCNALVAACSLLRARMSAHAAALCHAGVFMWELHEMGGDGADAAS